MQFGLVTCTASVGLPRKYAPCPINGTCTRPLGSTTASRIFESRPESVQITRHLHVINNVSFTKRWLKIASTLISVFLPDSETVLTVLFGWRAGIFLHLTASKLMNLLTDHTLLSSILNCAQLFHSVPDKKRSMNVNDFFMVCGHSNDSS